MARPLGIANNVLLLRHIASPLLLTLVGLLAATTVRAQEPGFTVLSAYAEDADGAATLQPGRVINIVLIANNQGESAARNARVRVELRTSTVSFVNEPALRTTDAVLGDFGARVSQQVFIPVTATERTASIEIIVTPLFDGQSGAPVPQTHRFPTGFAGASNASPSVSTGVAAGTPGVATPGVGARRTEVARPAAGSRLTRAQLAALPLDASRYLQPDRAVSGALGRAGLRLNNNSPVEIWYYEGVAGERVTITLTSPSLDTYLMLNRLGTARDIATDDDGAGNLNSRITQRLPETGTYVIIANALGVRANGDYTLTLNSDRAATVTSAPSIETPTSSLKGAAAAGISTPGSLATAGRPLTVPEVLAYAVDASRVVRMGATVSGRLTASDPKLTDNTYFHAYYFNGFEGDRVSITLRSGDFDAYLHFGQLGASAALANDDDSGGGRNSRVTVTLPATGTYVIIANVLSGGDRGAYTLEVRSP